MSTTFLQHFYNILTTNSSDKFLMIVIVETKK